MTLAALLKDRWFILLIATVLLISFVPMVVSKNALGDAYLGVPVSFTDSAMYKSHVAHVGRGYLSDGNPYFMEHANEPALIIFLGDYLHALPMLAGLSLNTTLLVNLLLFSALFAASFYILLLRLGVSRALSFVGVGLLYLLFFSHVDRPSNMQPFLPLLALFYIGLLSLITSKRGVILVAVAYGAMFYFYSYLWQSFTITLGLLFLYFLVQKKWTNLRKVFLAGCFGVLIGLPSIVYILWLSSHSPYFWESIGRYGLVLTHLPMMETLYSGGWVGLALVFLLFLLWRSKTLRQSTRFSALSVFFCVTGLGLWIMQASNVITGKLLENAQHMVYFIIGWQVLFVLAIGTVLWKECNTMGNSVKVFAVAGLAVITLHAACLIYNEYVPKYLTITQYPSVIEGWKDEQGYLAPLAYIDAHEPEPVVVWEDPHDVITWNTPLLSKNYVLFSTPGMWHLVPEGEVVERYLVAQYFANPTEETLKKDMDLYLGRQWAFHLAKTEERGVKLCKILHMYDTSYDCGPVPTSVDVIGEERFKAWEEKFTNDIKPNIKEYLAKYHVSYILKDTKRHPEYAPETLGAVKVYEDGRYELWKLP